MELTPCSNLQLSSLLMFHSKLESFYSESSITSQLLSYCLNNSLTLTDFLKLILYTNSDQFFFVMHLGSTFNTIYKLNDNNNKNKNNN